MEPGHYFSLLGLAPEARLELATSKLTASCSTIELLRNTLFTPDHSTVPKENCKQFIRCLLFGVAINCDNDFFINWNAGFWSYCNNCVSDRNIVRIKLAFFVPSFYFLTMNLQIHQDAFRK